ncbi:hypothetical protein JM658_09280 [Joostella atrarenae]|uniref:Uncharacterized protein n=1 Tax=Joostella atrarenae TaxID=679257 RepID=A0ABS9J3K5_9FLAO|nr:DUF6452 family protein [Joostella atrarenae]MCF8715013.1 hypothetical protein [Joostella atrarenae]
MKKLLAVFFILAIGGAIFSACEKDDICPEETQTTPYLKVGFYDFSDQEEEKAVPNLRIIGLDNNDEVVDTLNTFSDRSSQTEVDIPLRTSETTSKFLFIYNSQDDDDGLETGDIDTLQFNYARQEYFISRGCGYGVNFSELVSILNPEYTGPDPNPDEWILALLDQDTNLEHQDTIHVKIYL